MAKLQILSATETREFQSMEQVIERTRVLKGRDSLWEFWGALRTVKSGRLYRENHGSFFSYLKSKGIEQSRVSRGINALDVKDSIEERAWLYDKAKVGMIMTERHLRELVGADEELLPLIFSTACDIAGDKPVSFRHLKTARAKVCTPKAKKRVSVRLDESGESIPDVMAESFAARYALSNISERIRLIVAELQALASRPGGQYIQFEELHSILSNASRAIAQSGFGITCQSCHGSGCDSCRDTGFHPKRKLREE